jgi:hypothetical protein
MKHTLFAIVLGATISAFAVVGLLFIVLAITGVVHSHEFYDWECCSDNDCMPLPEGAVTEERDGYHVAPFRGLDHTTVVAYNDKSIIKQSPDGKFHGCEYPANHLKCLYVPGRGF